ncbi:MAG: antibiotic biosynthesis monooxygenase [Emcibacter sp.]|nr:antibiotic biosynthesis monooxygenase [Emcibacter sp.]
MTSKILPPYYAVIFTSIRTDNNQGYAQTAEHMAALAADQPGYIGFESTQEGDRGISISYWKDLDSIKNWKNRADHLTAQKLGREKWYKSYTTRIAKVEREYSYQI